MEHAFQVKLARRTMLQGFAIEGIALSARHSGGTVVEHANGPSTLVVHSADERRETGVGEGGVADDGHYGAMFGACPSKLEAMGHGNGGAHVDARVHGGKRGQGAQRVASDIARDDGLDARELLEHQTMRATGAQRGRAARNVGRRLRMCGSLLSERRTDKAGTQFAVARQAAREIGDANAQRTYRVGQVGRTFLYDVQRIHACLELAQRLRGQGIRDAELEHRCIRESLHHMLVGSTGAHHANSRALALDAVELAGFNPFGKLIDALKLHLAARLGERRHHDPFSRVALIGLKLVLSTQTALDRGLRVGHAHGGADEERHVEALGKIEGIAGERQGLSGIGGIHHGDVSRRRIVMGVLLVLGGIHAGIVGCKHHIPAADAGIGGGEQRVRRNVDADVLHGGQHARAGRTCADAHLNGDLLVDAPFRVHAVHLRKGLKRFGGRRARISHADAATGLPCALGYRLVS